MKDRYSIGVGLAFLALVAFVFLHGVGSNDQGTLGLDRLAARWPLPEFAVPVAARRLEGDANVAQDNCESSQVPCPADARRTPACHVAGADVIRACDLFDRPSVISFWFTKGGDCGDRQDVVEEAFRRYGGQVNFLSLDVRDDRDTVRDLIHRHRWTMPVGYDRDGAVAGLFRVGGCPTLAYIYPGGTLQSASIGDFTISQLDARIEELMRATREAERS